MPVIAVLPAVIIFILQLWAPNALAQLSVPFPASAYLALGLVLILSSFMRQWQWLYWLALLLSSYFTIQSGLQRPLSEPDVAALYNTLPVLLTLLMLILTLFPLPSILTWQGIALAIMIAALPPVLLVMPLADWSSALALSEALLIQPYDNLALNWGLLSLIFAVGSLWLLMGLYFRMSLIHWGEFATWMAMMNFVIFVHLPDASGWATLAATLSLLITLAWQMLHLAYMDELTGLPQRRALLSHLNRLGKRSAVTMLDVDHFKQFNDTYGHDVGDQVLKLLGSVLSKTKSCKAYRYGGEEFTLIFPHKDPERLEAELNEIRQQVADYPLVLRQNQRPEDDKAGKTRRGNSDGGKAIHITISLGCTAYQKGDDSDSLLKRADNALYAAKKAGRNRVKFA
ncbi:hypothetical protein HMF8227_01054 [Saliniradius amylolyticus]|uniref:diguanylate cyclase n=1 Tax=Saliniradius amylolyticus TaxID=2183582 RepID=A0A2S2E1Z6_9ALTE|nr:hypothetical protein HMF8227_01054 [Saliniradius amylolyticus]